MPEHRRGSRLYYGCAGCQATGSVWHWWSLQGVCCMSYWLGDVWNGFFDFVSEESREQQINRALKARKGCVGRSGEDTLVARARPATTDTRPACRHARAGHRSAIRIGSQEQDRSSPLRTNRETAHSNRSRNFGRSLKPSHSPHKLLIFPIVHAGRRTPRRRTSDHLGVPP